MRIAIISDIHGNLPALEAVLSAIGQKKIDKIICLGDVCGYYPFVNECISLLRANQIATILGNHDGYILHGTRCPRSTSANRCLDYQQSIILKEHIEWLSQCPQIIANDIMSCVHGGWHNYEDEYIKDISADYFDAFTQKYFFAGHTHVQKVITFASGKVFCNPGSVGQPRDGDERAAYCIFDTKSLEIIPQRVRYDIEPVAKKMQTLGFEAYFYENLYNGTRIGGIVDTIEETYKV